MGLTLLILALLSPEYCESTLRLVNLVYRHGDRSPAFVFPTDPNKSYKWPGGTGWLSKLGMQQQYNLGQFLRRRYIDTGFMSEDYKNTELRVYSSDVPRTLMSAYCNLAGMFPPGPHQRFNAALNWQPIPVHTRPVPEDNMLAFGKSCPFYNQLAEESYNDSAVQKEEESNKDFYHWLENKTGIAPLNISNIVYISDVVLAESIHNLTLAPWINATVFDKLMSLTDYQFKRFFDTIPLQRLTGGPLLKEFLGNMKNEVLKMGSVKLFMYSAHDGTVAALLSALHVFNDIRPPYNAMVIVELHQNDRGQYYVNLFYKNTTFSDDLIDLVLPNCSKDCLLERFIELTKPVVPVDWNKECEAQPVHTRFNSTSDDGITCFACKDISSLKYCDIIQRCKYGEMCYVSKSTNVDGQLRYSSGCATKQLCHASASNGTDSPCLQCCSKRYCNHVGCGEPGFPDRSNRGPLCLDCSNIGNIEDCHTVQLCSSDQSCSVDEHVWGENKRQYKLGCKSKVECALAIKRSNALCSSCCDDDFCNGNCTATFTLPPAVIG